MPKPWPSQARFVEVLKSLRAPTRAKIDELLALALLDARQYYKHAVTILVKQIQAKKPRQRVPVLYVLSALTTRADDPDAARTYAGRLAPDVLTCLSAALRCPPEHLPGVRKVIRRWRRLGTFDEATTARAEALARDAAKHAPSSSSAAAVRATLSAPAEDADDYEMSDPDTDAEDEPTNHRAAGAEEESAPSANAPAAKKMAAANAGGVTRTSDFAVSRVNRWPTRPPPKPTPGPAPGTAPGPGPARDDGARAETTGARSGRPRTPPPPGPAGAGPATNPPPPAGADAAAKRQNGTGGGRRRSRANASPNGSARLRASVRRRANARRRVNARRRGNARRRVNAARRRRRRRRGRGREGAGAGGASRWTSGATRSGGRTRARVGTRRGPVASGRVRRSESGRRRRVQGRGQGRGGGDRRRPRRPGLRARVGVGRGKETVEVTAEGAAGEEGAALAVAREAEDAAADVRTPSEAKGAGRRGASARRATLVTEKRRRRIFYPTRRYFSPPGRVIAGDPLAIGTTASSAPHHTARRRRAVLARRASSRCLTIRACSLAAPASRAPSSSSSPRARSPLASRAVRLFATSRCSRLSVVTFSSSSLTPDAYAPGARSDDDSSDSDADDSRGMMKLPWVKTPKRRILGGEAFNDENAPSSPERATDADGGKRETHYGRSIPAWSPGLRGRSARNREVLLVARNAREQARENEFLRLRVRELEREIGEHHERDAADASASRRDAAARESQSRSETAALKAEAAAHAASAAQLEEELERMRAIEDQSAEEAMRLIQKISSLQTDLAAATRRATIAEEMLAGTKSEGERAVEDAERWRLEAARVEAEKSKQTELEKSYADATEELKSLREENALMRADISALHSGMEAQLRAEEDCFADADEKTTQTTTPTRSGRPRRRGSTRPGRRSPGRRTRARGEATRAARRQSRRRGTG